MPTYKAHLFKRRNSGTREEIQIKLFDKEDDPLSFSAPVFQVGHANAFTVVADPEFAEQRPIPFNPETDVVLDIGAHGCAIDGDFITINPKILYRVLITLEADDDPLDSILHLTSDVTKSEPHMFSQVFIGHLEEGIKQQEEYLVYGPAFAPALNGHPTNDQVAWYTVTIFALGLRE